MPFSDPIVLRSKLFTEGSHHSSSAQGTLGDAHDQSEQLHVLERIAEFRRAALDAAAIVAVTDRKGRITAVNEKFCELSGYSERELIGATHAIVNSGVHDRAFFQNLYGTILAGDIWHGVICNRAKSGRHYWVDTTIVPNGDGSGFTAIRFDVTPQKEAEQRLWRHAHIDALTDLPNRRHFMELLAGAVASGKPFAAAILDLDHFKDVNDTAGHDAGDRLLVALATALRSALGPNETIGRLGGDEFALILIDDGDGTRLSRKLARLIEVVRNHPMASAFGWSVNASIGVARHPVDGGDDYALLKCADIALYAAKRSGRGRAHIFAAADRRDAERQANMRSKFKDALAERALFILYQPILSLEKPSIPAFESLLRWRGADGTVRSPGHFATVFDDEQIASKIGMFVLSSAISQIERWNSIGHAFAYISVNATLADFRDPAFVDLIASAISEGRVRRGQLCVEITENVVMDRGTRVIAQATARLQKLGVRLAFDDFGTGFASLSHLRDLPLDIVKIDRAFVQAIGSDARDAFIVRSVIDLAHGLGMRVVAEGVESSDQLGALARLGCDDIQGYLIAKPMDATRATSFVIPSRMPRFRCAA